jgi:hypothetical protein
MVGNMSVQDYASLFRQQIVHIPEMHENDRIRWFHSGLAPQLRILCIVDQSGNDFTSVETLTKSAVGHERQNIVTLQHNNTTLGALSLACPLHRA